MDDLALLSIQDASALLRTREVSPVDLAKACLDRIQALNPSLNAFITVTADAALAEARRAESEMQRGLWRGPLHGIPVALKDSIDTAGVRTTGGSAVFEHRVPREDAAVVVRLRSAGAVLLGKLNMQEFAYGGTSVPSHFGAVLNPWDLKCIAGGSSGGSAAAVAAGLCYASLGSDTGGSIREPAAFCGVVGLKPTYGAVSNRGVIPLSWSLDTLGPITRTVADSATVLQAIAGYDPDDLSSQARPPGDYREAISRNRGRLRIGIPRDFFYAALDATGAGGDRGGAVGARGRYRDRRCAARGEHGSDRISRRGVRLSRRPDREHTAALPSGNAGQTADGGRHRRANLYPSPPGARSAPAQHVGPICIGRPSRDADDADGRSADSAVPLDLRRGPCTRGGIGPAQYAPLQHVRNPHDHDSLRHDR